LADIAQDADFQRHIAQFVLLGVEHDDGGTGVGMSSQNCSRDFCG